MELPKIGQTYNCFDDGKIKKSRLYQVTITEIIPFNDADEELLTLWKAKLQSYWLFDKTDYFIKFTSTEYELEPNGVFARTKQGDWFGLGTLSGASWNSGLLDLNGTLTKYLYGN
jgi:hypothetical protein